MAAEKKMKNIILVPSARSENELVSGLSIMTQEINAVNSIILSPGNIDPITASQAQALRKVLLQDWKALLQIMAALFTEAYQEVKPLREIRIIVGRTGVPELSIQA